jgi:hypothetical protein
MQHSSRKGKPSAGIVIKHHYDPVLAEAARLASELRVKRDDHRKDLQVYLPVEEEVNYPSPGAPIESEPMGSQSAPNHVVYVVYAT